MYYDKRNRENLNKLAENTRKAAYKWYQYCLDNKVDILIYETIRTKVKQKENVKNGKSKTMKSYHLVGQALDFVPVVDSKGTVGWSINDYTRKKILDAINYAKKLGFTWGGDWDNDGNWRDETFLDAPHLQFEYKGYGTDGRQPVSSTSKPSTPVKTPSKPLVKSIDDLAKEVIDGKHGVGEARKKSLGAQYQVVQARVNVIMQNKTKTPKSISQLADEVLKGLHGTGRERMKSLGTNYAAVQKEVNRRLKN